MSINSAHKTPDVVKRRSELGTGGIIEGSEEAEPLELELAGVLSGNAVPVVVIAPEGTGEAKACVPFTAGQNVNV